MSLEELLARASGWLLRLFGHPGPCPRCGNVALLCAGWSGGSFVVYCSPFAGKGCGHRWRYTMSPAARWLYDHRIALPYCVYVACLERWVARQALRGKAAGT